MSIDDNAAKISFNHNPAQWYTSLFCSYLKDSRVKRAFMVAGSGMVAPGSKAL